MNKNSILAKNAKIGDIRRCHHGTIHLNCHGVSLRLTEEAFFELALMVEKAYLSLMNKSLSNSCYWTKIEKSN